MMKANGEAVYGTLFGPIQGQEGYRTTAKGDDMFVHIFDWPGNRLTLPDWGRKVTAVQLLADKRPLRFIPSDAGTEIDLAGITPDAAAAVLKVSTT